MSDAIAIPLTPVERKARDHALLCSIGFLIVLPIGVLVARYTRTYTRIWFWTHWIMQFLISGPIIFAGVALGYMAGNDLQLPAFSDAHQRVGLTLLILYLAQALLGPFIHFFKFPTVFRGHRPPQNYLHVAIGMAIFILAAYQAHYGLYTQWTLASGGLHLVPDSAKRAWLALIIIFWALYVLGLGLLPRQFRLERQGRSDMKLRETDDRPDKEDAHKSG